MSFGRKTRVVKAVGESGNVVPPGYCACGRKQTRSGLGTCGRQKCIQALQAKALGPAAERNGRDPGTGAKVKIDGRGATKEVSYTKSVRGTPCVVLKDGTTVPMSRIEVQ